MAKISGLDETAWNEWVETRPPVVQDLCRRFPPDRLYRLKDSGHRVTLYSYSEDGTMTVNVTGEYNAVIFSRRVFGINPDDMEECDLPGTDELLGELLTDENDIEAFIDKIRPEVLKKNVGKQPTIVPGRTCTAESGSNQAQCLKIDATIMSLEKGGSMRRDRCKCTRFITWDPDVDHNEVTCPHCGTVYTVESDSVLVYWLREKREEQKPYETDAR